MNTDGSSILKRTLAIVAFLLLSQLSVAQALPSATDVEKRVDSILGKMTVEEKITILGFFIPKESGDYKFLSADDGVRLYIDEERVIDNWQPHAETLDTYTKHL